MTKHSSLLQDRQSAAALSIEILNTLLGADLNDLCDATDQTILDGGGFGWLASPGREALERYWQGVLAVPERHLIVARMDAVICGAVQLVEPSRHNEAQSFAATLTGGFVAPWARRQGAAARLIDTAETLAASLGYHVLNLDVRETQQGAISLLEKAGYKCWGVHPHDAFVGGRMIAGYHYYKMTPPFLKTVDKT